jgi:hypothetical protein
MPQVKAALAVGSMLMQGSAAKGARRAQQDAAALANQQATDQLEFKKEQMALLEEQKQKYREFEFQNPYAGMENVFEDLTVNQESARFQMEQGSQQRANIMQQMQGAAGSSGVAGLAQALAGQGAMQARQVSADIGKQEQLNQMAAAKGAQGVDMAQRSGEQMMQEAEMQRQSTLLGVAYQGAAGASSGLNQAYANQMNMNMAGVEMQMQNSQMWGNMATTAAGEVEWDNLF